MKVTDNNGKIYNPIIDGEKIILDKDKNLMMNIKSLTICNWKCINNMGYYVCFQQKKQIKYLDFYIFCRGFDTIDRMHYAIFNIIIDNYAQTLLLFQKN